MNISKIVYYTLAATFVFNGYSDASAVNNDIIFEDSNSDVNNTSHQKKHLFGKIKSKLTNHKNTSANDLQFEDRSLKEAYQYLSRAKINTKFGKFKNNNWEEIKANLLAAKSKVKLTNTDNIVSYNMLTIIDKQIAGQTINKYEKNILKEYIKDWNKIFKKGHGNLAYQLESLIGKYLSFSKNSFQKNIKPIDTLDIKQNHFGKALDGKQNYSGQVPVPPPLPQEISKSHPKNNSSFLDDIKSRRDKGTAGLRHVDRPN